MSVWLAPIYDVPGMVLHDAAGLAVDGEIAPRPGAAAPGAAPEGTLEDDGGSARAQPPQLARSGMTAYHRLVCTVHSCDMVGPDISYNIHLM